MLPGFKLDNYSQVGSETMQSMLQDTYPTHNRDVGRSSGRPTLSAKYFTTAGRQSLYEYMIKYTGTHLNEL